ncbi:hypothetical protein BT67DRAFT_442764 [Trichocladium antarcticum]|uniref:Uncharacterized protein n=1 Tax=Trichocladium antarcticum TaxID=1450529 RepID=A0AAN6ZDC9_9PEZI|nr:hypothetical protein BT67DRAFT_442764 [Trichocladium antarcticum]
MSELVLIGTHRQGQVSDPQGREAGEEEDSVCPPTQKVNPETPSRLVRTRDGSGDCEQHGFLTGR